MSKRGPEYYAQLQAKHGHKRNPAWKKVSDASTAAALRSEAEDTARRAAMNNQAQDGHASPKADQTDNESARLAAALAVPAPVSAFAAAFAPMVEAPAHDELPPRAAQPSSPLDPSRDGLPSSSGAYSAQGCVVLPQGQTRSKQPTNTVPRRHNSSTQTRYQQVFDGFSSAKDELKNLYILRAGLSAGGQIAVGAGPPLNIHQAVGEGCLLQRARAVACMSHCGKCGEPLSEGSVFDSRHRDISLVSLSCGAIGQQPRPVFHCQACNHQEHPHPILLGCFPATAACATRLGPSTWFDEDVMVASRAMRRHGQYGLTAWTHVLQDVQHWRRTGTAFGCGTAYKDMRDLALVSALALLCSDRYGNACLPADVQLLVSSAAVNDCQCPERVLRAVSTAGRLPQHTASSKQSWRTCAAHHMSQGYPTAHAATKRAQLRALMRVWVCAVLPSQPQSKAA
jgi:hypothetical protein